MLGEVIVIILVTHVKKTKVLWTAKANLVVAMGSLNPITLQVQLVQLVQQAQPVPKVIMDQRVELAVRVLKALWVQLDLLEILLMCQRALKDPLDLSVMLHFQAQLVLLDLLAVKVDKVDRGLKELLDLLVIRVLHLPVVVVTKVHLDHKVQRDLRVI